MIETWKADNFNEQVIQSDQPVLVDFWAPWCSHCVALNPVLEEFAQQSPHVRIGKINVDEEPELARQYNIRTIPTVMVIKDGEITDKKIAPKEIEELEDLLS
ncbi:MAG: thioredoxin [Blautia sp.]|jgi:thioredoxin 1